MYIVSRKTAVQISVIIWIFLNAGCSILAADLVVRLPPSFVGCFFIVPTSGYSSPQNSRSEFVIDSMGLLYVPHVFLKGKTLKVYSEDVDRTDCMIWKTASILDSVVIDSQGVVSPRGSGYLANGIYVYADKDQLAKMWVDNESNSRENIRHSDCFEQHIKKLKSINAFKFDEFDSSAIMEFTPSVDWPN